MYKNVLQSIAGVEMYAIISMLLFVGIFTGMLLIVFRMNRATVEQISRLPLDNDIVS